QRALARPRIANDIADPARAGDVLERTALLGGKFKAPSRGPSECVLAVTIADAVTASCVEGVGRALEPLLDLDHRARRKALVAARVLAERYQLGRGFDRSHHRVELLLAVAMAVREHRKIAGSEGSLPMGDRVDRGRGVGDEPFAV